MYTVFWCGGVLDGMTIAKFDSEAEAIKFANRFFKDHEREFGVASGSQTRKACR